MHRATYFAFIFLFGFAGLASDLKSLHCGNVFDSKAAKLIGPHTIVVEGNTIKQVTPGTFQVAGAQVIELTHMTCLPGFIDMHVHLSGQSTPKGYEERFRLDDIDFAFRSVGFAEKTLLAGFTTVRDLGGKVSLHLRNAINQGLVKGPRIFAAGTSIATTGGHADPTNGWNHQLSTLATPPGPIEGVINGIDDAQKAVRQRYKEGSDVIKITATGGVLSYAKSADAPQFTIEEIKAVVATAQDYGFTVAAHAHGKEGIRRAILGGVNSIEHGTYLDDEMLRLLKRHETWYVPTLSAGQFVLDKSKVDGFYPEIIRPKAARVGAQIQATFSKAYKAGVKIAFGTDAGVSFHGENAAEFIYMTQGGMPANLALQTATFNAAQLLAATDLGQLESGFKADIVAVVGDPTKDIKLTQNISFVMKDGSVYRQ